MNDGLVQISFALDASGNLVSIKNAKTGQRYQCPGCRESMAAVKGQNISHHFRHLNAECRFETYLHQAAKEAFYQTFIKSSDKGEALSLTLERKVRCRSNKAIHLEAYSASCINTISANYDLTKLFSEARLEKNDDTGMRPDVLLFDSISSRKCYVEICVTHRCTEEKIQLGIPIIEFSLAQVDDINYLIKGRYHYSDPLITLHNFNAPERDIEACIDTCNMSSKVFRLVSISDTGLVRINKKKLSELSEQELKSKACLHENMTDVDIANRISACIEQGDPGSSYPNCLRCVHSRGWNNGSPTCLKKQKNVQYTEARQCQHYREVNGEEIN